MLSLKPFPTKCKVCSEPVNNTVLYSSSLEKDIIVTICSKRHVRNGVIEIEEEQKCPLCENVGHLKFHVSEFPLLMCGNGHHWSKCNLCDKVTVKDKSFNECEYCYDPRDKTINELMETSEPITKIEIGNTCCFMNPCEYKITVHYQTLPPKTESLFAIHIIKLCKMAGIEVDSRFDNLKRDDGTYIDNWYDFNRFNFP